VNSELRDLVASKLILDWSPEQIAGWLKTQYPHDEGMRVSHETLESTSKKNSRISNSSE